MDESFSVYQFFPNGTYECVRTNVDLREAIRAAKHYSESVGARIGSTQRVIITDGGDFTVFEWKHGQGVVFPPPTSEKASTHDD